ncbi:hypothetical protein CL658_01365 [bacterium]|nr:hypothetical protein [bacterium]|tara:strand:- start:663 stop:2213 length:1551 start_codon:yes stop_codon:yes gene_type:complete
MPKFNPLPRVPNKQTTTQGINPDVRGAKKNQTASKKHRTASAPAPNKMAKVADTIALTFFQLHHRNQRYEGLCDYPVESINFKAALKFLGIAIFISYLNDAIFSIGDTVTVKPSLEDSYMRALKLQHGDCKIRPDIETAIEIYESIRDLSTKNGKLATLFQAKLYQSFPDVAHMVRSRDLFLQLASLKIDRDQHIKGLAVYELGKIDRNFKEVPNGFGVDAENTFVKWTKEAATKFGNDMAARKLGNYYVTRSSHPFLGFLPKEEEAIKNLGRYPLAAKRNLTSDMKEAIKFYALAAKRNDVLAIADLGHVYLALGHYNKALLWYEKTSHLGHIKEIPEIPEETLQELETFGTTYKEEAERWRSLNHKKSNPFLINKLIIKILDELTPKLQEIKNWKDNNTLFENLDRLIDYKEATKVFILEDLIKMRIKNLNDQLEITHDFEPQHKIKGIKWKLTEIDEKLLDSLQNYMNALESVFDCPLSVLTKIVNHVNNDLLHQLLRLYDSVNQEFDLATEK